MKKNLKKIVGVVLGVTLLVGVTVIKGGNDDKLTANNYDKPVLRSVIDRDPPM